MSGTLDSLQAEVIDGIRRYFESEGPEATVRLREVARAMVQAREQFTLMDGTPDWKGRSGDYRRWIGEALTEAGVEDRHSLQSALRYHTGELIRQRLSERELEEYGFLPDSPRTQISERRSEMQSLYNLVAGSGPIKQVDDREAALRLIKHMLSRVERGSTPKQFHTFLSKISSFG